MRLSLGRTIGIFIGLAAVAAVACEEDANWNGYEWTYGDWRVSFETHDSTQDDWLICSARTGGDGSPVLSVGMFGGDAGPPHGFPDISIEESAPRHYRPQMREGTTGYIVFPDGSGAYSEVEAWTDEDGIEIAMMTFLSPDTQPLLQSMTQQSHVDVVVDENHIIHASLDGFGAAYLKMMETCGFDGAGVLE